MRQVGEEAGVVEALVGGQPAGGDDDDLAAGRVVAQHLHDAVSTLGERGELKALLQPR